MPLVAPPPKPGRIRVYRVVNEFVPTQVLFNVKIIKFKKAILNNITITIDQLNGNYGIFM